MTEVWRTSDLPAREIIAALRRPVLRNGECGRKGWTHPAEKDKRKVRRRTDDIDN
jgi:hypothetical protein